MSSKSLLLINHGGSFRRLPHFSYSGGPKSKFQCDPDHLSVDNIKDMILTLGYLKSTVKCIYFSRPNSPLEESIVSIKSDKEVHEVIRLSSSGQYLSLFVEHDKGDDKVEDGGDNGNMAEDNYANYGSDKDDEEGDQLRKKVRQIVQEFGAEIKAFEVENEEWRSSSQFIEGVLNEFGEVNALESFYQDSDNANSPLSSDTDVDDDDDGGTKKKKKKESYPRYNPSTSVEDVKLEVGMMFKDKEHVKETLDSYRIIKGYNLKTQQSDKGRLQVRRRRRCNASGLAPVPQPIIDYHSLNSTGTVSATSSSVCVVVSSTAVTSHPPPVSAPPFFDVAASSPVSAAHVRRFRFTLKIVALHIKGMKNQMQVPAHDTAAVLLLENTSGFAFCHSSANFGVHFDGTCGESIYGAMQRMIMLG
ncbi:hypothetical protein Cgig2_005708 [Carnegiea gigantea]|uniref:PB1-like domain-containing protein n=1 Tax=Carnegiea gigantea TaxID=171969 RepID=A0A9Q1QI80_9CARY|nr:hypothetical protein Cgig2_005708 [Carnegiea gigantea]